MVILIAVMVEKSIRKSVLYISSIDVGTLSFITRLLLTLAASTLVQSTCDPLTYNDLQPTSTHTYIVAVSMVWSEQLAYADLLTQTHPTPS